jgi:crotonobetainyl-CoA:carnitine CoA-transferase CaiB-like acyl-CoA transferase
MLLALKGAEVIKVEPLGGDWSRALGAVYGDHSAVSITYNRGKRSIAIDLKTAEGSNIARRLIARCDILIEGYRPGVAARLGMSYEEVKRFNPKILYVSVSGFGQSGPYAKLPFSDSVAQAFSGLMSINAGNDGIPHRIGITIIDIVTGLYALQALAAALFAREMGTEPEGRHLDISLLQSAAAIQATKIAAYHLEGGMPKALNAPAGSYRTKDGWITITFVKEEEFQRLCEAIECEKLHRDPRFSTFFQRAKNIEPLAEFLSQTFAKKTTEQWIVRLKAAGVLHARINDYGDWLADTHVKSVGAAPVITQPGVGKIPMPNIPGQPKVEAGDSLNVAPAIGNHTRQILSELGYADQEIETLDRKSIVRLQPKEDRRESNER